MHAGPWQTNITDLNDICWHFVTARKLKALNPSVSLFLYETIVFSPINFPPQYSFKANPAWRLKDDNDQTMMVMKPGLSTPQPWGIDWRSQATKNWFSRRAFICGFPSIFEGVLADGADESLDGSDPATDPSGKTKYEFSPQSIVERVNAQT